MPIKITKEVKKKKTSPAVKEKLEKARKAKQKKKIKKELKEELKEETTYPPYLKTGIGLLISVALLGSVYYIKAYPPQFMRSQISLKEKEEPKKQQIQQIQQVPPRSKQEDPLPEIHTF